MSLPKFVVAGGLWAVHFPNYRCDDDKTLLAGFVSLLPHQQATIRWPDIYSVIILYRTADTNLPPSSPDSTHGVVGTFMFLRSLLLHRIHVPGIRMLIKTS